MSHRAQNVWLFAIWLIGMAAISLIWVASNRHDGAAVGFAAEAAGGAKPDELNRYIRVVKDGKENPEALETSIVRLAPAGNDRPGLQVDLVSAIHVADKSYYDELNKRFSRYDVVLYEMVAPEGTVIPKGGLDPNRNALSAAQNGMKDLLALEYQLNGVDYTKKNFVHADLSPDEFFASMKNRGESIWTILGRMIAAAAAQQEQKRDQKNPKEPFWSYGLRIVASGVTGGDVDPDGMRLLMALADRNRALKLKRIVADQLADAVTFVSAFEGPQGSTLISDRNNVALKVLGQQIAAGKKKIAIFYGGGHMADLERRAIEKFNLKPAGVEWLEAWNLRDAK